MKKCKRVTVDVPLDQAVSLAIDLTKRGQSSDAEKVFKLYLEVVPEDAKALHYYGVLAHKQGRTDYAIALMEKSLAFISDDPDWHSNIGLVLKAQGRWDEAMSAFRHAIELTPTHANAHNNLGLLLRAQGRLQEAEDALRTAIRLNASQMDAWHNLGNLLLTQSRTPEAVTCYCKAITLAPFHPELRRSLAEAYAHLGELGKAADIYREWVEAQPDNAIAQHMLAACSGQNVPPRAKDECVERLFDTFASSFEAKLERLSYQAPALIGAMLADSGLARSKSLDILDVGCGTGLCGPFIAPYARQLTGVDLSAGMLAQAAEKAVYDNLLKHELTDYLRGQHQAFDVIVSADTLVYFGALEDVAAAVANALRPGGWFLFTLEEASCDADLGYKLCHHGRYAHDRHYVAAVLRRAGLYPELGSAELRKEFGAPVAGLTVRAQQTSTRLQS